MNDALPKLRSVDRSPQNGWTPPPTAVREWASVYHYRDRPNWPFLINIEKGETYINRAKPTNRNEELNQLGDALL